MKNRQNLFFIATIVYNYLLFALHLLACYFILFVLLFKWLHCVLFSFLYILHSIFYCFLLLAISLLLIFFSV